MEWGNDGTEEPDFEKQAKVTSSTNPAVLEYIIRMKVISTEKSKLKFRAYYSDTSLDAHEFFPDNEGGYSSTYNQIYFGARYI